MSNLKQLLTISFATLYLLLSAFNSSAQSVGINSTGALPDSSALLDLSSTDKGFLITRVDTANIASPAFGLMTLAPSDSCLYLYNGNAWMGLGGGGTNCSCNCKPAPVFPCDGTVIPIVDVTSITGKTWMDRNLGASQVASSSNNVAAFGDLYQWGRCSDGHEKRTSNLTATQSTTDTPEHGDFITSVIDWRSSQNDNLWQGVAGINNPCPTGYRLPTESELDAERLSWATNNAAGAFASPLKLSVAGYRNCYLGNLLNVGSIGYYWVSTIDGTGSKSLSVLTNNAAMGSSFSRADGKSVRCIKD